MELDSAGQKKPTSKIQQSICDYEQLIRPEEIIRQNMVI